MTQIIKPGSSAPLYSRAVRLIMDEGDELNKRIGAMRAASKSAAFKSFNELDQHLFTLQIEQMQVYLHTLTIRLARQRDAEVGIVPGSASALGGGGVITTGKLDRH